MKTAPTLLLAGIVSIASVALWTPNAAAGQPVAPIHRSKSPAVAATEFAQRTKPTSVDWTTLPSTYSHDENGTRLDQYSQGVQPVVALSPDYVRSGFRHTRSTLQAGFSNDNYHVVEQWGGDVRPYGEWRYPNRPFAVPYGMWGPQLPQVVGGMPWGGFVPPAGYPSPNQPGSPFGGGVGGGFGVGPWNALGPTQDDYYPQAPIMQAPPTPHYAPLGIGLP
ncbi:hypothetical protein SH467x_003201 [Pirellulaceae bacterium SH467]